MKEQILTAYDVRCLPVGTHVKLYRDKADGLTWINCTVVKQGHGKALAYGHGWGRSTRPIECGQGEWFTREVSPEARDA